MQRHAVVPPKFPCSHFEGGVFLRHVQNNLVTSNACYSVKGCYLFNVEVFHESYIEVKVLW
jgi:hypothetical protein